MKAPIYLDYNATTPVAPEVANAMLPFLREHFGNPSSSHPFGRFAAQAVAEARNQVAALIGARAHEMVFTGCATEANNLALLGVARALGDTKRHLVVSAIEHPAVMAPAQHLQEKVGASPRCLSMVSAVSRPKTLRKPCGPIQRWCR